MATARPRDEGRLSGAGGLTIFWRSWLPADSPTGLVLVSHGAGEHSGRYEHVGQALAGAGYAVFALDHRGHGRSAGARAVITRMDDALDDLDALRTLAVGRHAGIPVFLLGHSMGATIALRYAISHGDRLHGLILSGALAELDAAPAPLRAIVPVLSAVAPQLGLIAVDPASVSRDPAVVSAYEADPLVHHGKLPARTIAEIAGAVASFPAAVASITTPTLIAYGTADRLCPPSGSLMLHERIGASDKTLLAYEGLAHEILNEPEQDRVLHDLLGWLRARNGSR